MIGDAAPIGGIDIAPVRSDRTFSSHFCPLSRPADRVLVRAYVCVCVCVCVCV